MFQMGKKNLLLELWKPALVGEWNLILGLASVANQL